MSINAVKLAEAADTPRPEEDGPYPVLLALEREARSADSRVRLGFIAVNQTHRLIDYEQCLLWRQNARGKVRVQAVSGVSHIDPHSPALLSLRRLINGIRKSVETSTEPRQLTMADVDSRYADDWQAWLPDIVLWCPFSNRDAPQAGLLITRDQPFQPGELSLLQPLLETYAYAWRALGPGEHTAGARLLDLVRRRWVRIAAVAALAGLLALPVRESALAPGEIVPVRPLMVSAPQGGVIKQFLVRPNERVSAGQLLFTLDDTEIRSRYAIAEKSLAVARADYMRASQKSFSDPQSKSELELYKVRVEQKQLERDHAQTLLNRTQVRAERSGIAVFSDANEWLGRPVEVGQRILSLADPEQAEIQFWLAVADGINLEPGARVQFFLNTAPASPLAAQLRQTSYEPEQNPAGGVAFRLKASLMATQPTPRIGLQGTAKVFGDEVSLFYYVMRRPLSVLRQTFGF